MIVYVRHAIRSEAFDVVAKVEGFRLARSITTFYLVIRFLNELPPLGGMISRSPSCEASAIRSRARYVTVVVTSPGIRLLDGK